MYFWIENGIIDGKAELYQPDVFTDDRFQVEVSGEIYNDYEPNKYVYLGGEVVINPNWEEIQKQKEEERINNLTMTPLDFIGVLVDAGLTLEQINAFLESNLNIKMQLTYCSNVYCGVVKQFLPMTVNGITITAEMVETAFRIKNGEGVA